MPDVDNFWLTRKLFLSYNCWYGRPQHSEIRKSPTAHVLGRRCLFLWAYPDFI